MGTEDAGRKLIVLRHAKSDWPDVADHERPLAKRGRRDAPVVGRWLGEAGYVPDAVICSTAQRARQTWELVSAGLAEAAPGVSPVVRFEPRVYEAAVLGLLMLVREFDDAWHTAMIIGHNPGLAGLATGLASPAVYAAARRAVTVSSTPTRIADGPSVPSSNSPSSTGKVYSFMTQAPG